MSIINFDKKIFRLKQIGLIINLTVLLKFLQAVVPKIMYIQSVITNNEKQKLAWMFALCKLNIK